MASPNTLARNAELAHLKLNPVLLTPAQPGRRTAPGEYKELLKMSGRLYRQRLARERAARNTGRVIPTSGQARRRAKAHERAGLCLTRVDARLCPETAVYGRFCEQHVPAVTEQQ